VGWRWRTRVSPPFFPLPSFPSSSPFLPTALFSGSIFRGLGLRRWPHAAGQPGRAKRVSAGEGARKTVLFPPPLPSPLLQTWVLAKPGDIGGRRGDSSHIGPWLEFAEKRGWRCEARIPSFPSLLSFARGLRTRAHSGGGADGRPKSSMRRYR